MQLKTPTIDAMNSGSSLPPKKKKGACKTCHKAKSKCRWTNEAQPKCDRCLRLNKHCEPHVSMQGRRPSQSRRGSSKSETSAASEEDGALAGSLGSNNQMNDEIESVLEDDDFFRQLGSYCCSEVANIGDDLLLYESGTPSIGGDQGNVQDINDQVTAFLESFERGVQRRTSGGASSIVDVNNEAPDILDSLEDTVQLQPFPAALSSVDHVAAEDTPSINLQKEVHPSLSSVSLAEWCKGALESLGMDDTTNKSSLVSSPAYLAAALQIAICLSKQLQNLQDVDTSSICAHQVQIRLKQIVRDQYFMNLSHGGNQSATLDANNVDDEPLPFETAEPSTDLNGFFDHFAIGDFDANNQDEYILNYLDVHSAQIENIDAKSGRVPNITQQTEGQVIFYFGLILYQIFSGGELPSSDLNDLALSNGAFVSLSIMTLVKDVKEDEAVIEANPKRYQGPSGSTRDIGLCQIFCEYLNLIGVPAPVCSLLCNMLDCVYGELRGSPMM